MDLEWTPARPAECGSCSSIYNKPLPLVYMFINTPQHDPVLEYTHNESRACTRLPSVRPLSLVTTASDGHAPKKCRAQFAEAMPVVVGTIENT